MEKKDKIIVGTLLGMAALCFGLFFVFNVDNSHIVIFDTNGGTSIESQKVNDNELVTRPTNPVKENSEFVEWSLNGNAYNFQTAVTNDLVLVAMWKDVRTVTVELEGKTYSQTLQAGDKLDVSKFEFPSREGYVIKIYVSDDKEYDVNQSVTENLNLKANYVALQKFTVKYVTGIKEKIDDVEIYEGSLLTEPKISRDGYNLEGWYQENQKFDFSTPITSNMTLTAKWVEKGKLNVTFMVDETVYRVRNVKENDKVTKPKNTTKKGNIFVEWQLNGKSFNFSTPITSNLTLNAVFKEAQTYTVSFDSNGGSSIKDVTVTEGTKVSKPTNPTRKDYDFVEWQLNGKTYNFSNVVTSDITLKAIWEESKPKYIVQFDSNGGSNVAAQGTDKNQKVTKPTDPTRDNYEFEGWFLDNKKFDFNSTVTSDITLKAEWAPLKKYKVTFDCGDNSQCIASQEIQENEKAVNPATPSKNGATFDGWLLNGVKYDFNTPITKDITLTASWK